MSRFPDLIGPRGKGWDVTPIKHEFTLASWFANVPSAHPLWSWYFVNVVHLRGEVEGQGGPRLDYPEAEYELLIFALDPGEGLPPVDAQLTDKGIGPAKILTPQNMCLQFDGVSDEQAGGLAKLLVGAYLDGALTPDTDGNRFTRDSIAKTVLHFRGECLCHGAGEVMH